MVTDSAAYLIELQGLIANYFSPEDLRARMVAAGTKQDLLAGLGKQVLARELILVLAKDGRLRDFITLAQRNHPDVAWPTVPDEFVLPESWATTETAQTARVAPRGDLIHGDKITIGEIRKAGAIAIGAGARAEIKQYTEIIVRVDSLEDLPPAPGEPPFKGLTYFAEKDADIFFGREELTRKLVGRLRDTRFQAVVGASGSGKSSVLRAGVVPTLRRQDWLIHIMTPTADPLGQLASTLTRDDIAFTAADSVREALVRDPSTLQLAARKLVSRHNAAHLLLLVDQFEELFTLCSDESERRAFLDNLRTATETVGTTTVLMGLRADFYDRCLHYDSLRTVLAEHQEPIGPMSQEELVRAIAEPARRGHWQFVEGLVEQILEDVGHEPGRLPLLAHALLETWERRRGTVMTLAGYRGAGGVEGAIAQTAEETLAQLSTSQAAVVKQVFLSLTELGEGAEDTRRIATRAELKRLGEDRVVVDTVLEKLVDARLVTVDGDSVEVAHEALIRRWPRLREWLEYNRERLRFERQLIRDARQWHQLARDPGALYRGARLAQAAEWLESEGYHGDRLGVAFLTASRELAEREEREKELRRQRELAQQQALAEAQRKRAEEAEAASAKLTRRRNLAFGLAAGALLLAALAFILFRQSSKNAAVAEAEAARALSAENHVRSRLLFAQGQVEWEDNPLMGMQLVLASLASVIDRNDMQDTVSEMSDQLLTMGRSGHVSKVGNEIAQLHVSPGTDAFITSYLDGSSARLRYTFDDKPTVRLSGTELSRVAFSQDGSLVVIAYGDEDVRTELRRTSDGEVVCTLPSQWERGLISSLEISPENKYILLEWSIFTTQLSLETYFYDIKCSQIESILAGPFRFLPEDDEILVYVHDDGKTYWSLGEDGLAQDIPVDAGEGSTMRLPSNVQIDHNDRAFFSSSNNLLAIQRTLSTPRVEFEIRNLSDGQQLFKIEALERHTLFFNQHDSAIAIVDFSAGESATPSCNLYPDIRQYRYYPFMSPQVYLVPSGEKLESIREGGLCVRFTPGVETVSIAYEDRTEIHSLKETSLLATHHHAVDLDNLVFNAPGNVAWAKYERGSVALWDMESGAVLVDLGVGISDDSGFDATGKFFFAHYLDGRTYLIDIDFLKDMLTVEQDSENSILPFTCQVLSKHGYLLETEKLSSFLDGDSPRACP